MQLQNSSKVKKVKDVFLAISVLTSKQLNKVRTRD